ncbi:MAG: hypothetical protein E7009_01895 [Alphaproteobacteria bacterium]|nr:hypothetical protein [Alphaproteobacteria bacterium]
MWKLLNVGWLIFVVSCTKNTPLPNNACAPMVCNPIYGRATDWDVISDDLARNIYRHNRTCEQINRSQP